MKNKDILNSDLDLTEDTDFQDKLLATNGLINDIRVAGPNLPYDKLFGGAKSEWVVAFGDDKLPKTALGMEKNFHAMREKAPVDVRQYRGFKIFLEHFDFKPVQKQTTQDSMGLVVYTKKIKAPPDGHLHTLVVKVLNSTHLKEDAYNEFTKICIERRGYFSITHSSDGAGLWIGRKLIRPEILLESPAPVLIVVILSCLSFKYFLCDMITYLEEHNIPKEKLTFFGTSQDIETMQSNGAFAVLKEIFASMVAGKSGLAILHDCAEIYTPIMPSYDPNSYKRDPSSLLIMDKNIQAIPILKGWIMGHAFKLSKKMSRSQRYGNKQTR